MATKETDPGDLAVTAITEAMRRGYARGLALDQMYIWVNVGEARAELYTRDQLPALRADPTKGKFVDGWLEFGIDAGSVNLAIYDPLDGRINYGTLDENDNSRQRWCLSEPKPAS